MRHRSRQVALSDQGSATDAEAWPEWLHEELAKAHQNGCIGRQVVTENARARIWRTRLEPRERIAFHCHVLDYVWIALTDGVLQSRGPAGRVQSYDVSEGSVRFGHVPLNEPCVRDLENIGNAALRLHGDRVSRQRQQPASHPRSRSAQIACPSIAERRDDEIDEHPHPVCQVGVVDIKGMDRLEIAWVEFLEYRNKAARFDIRQNVEVGEPRQAKSSESHQAHRLAIVDPHIALHRLIEALGAVLMPALERPDVEAAADIEVQAIVIDQVGRAAGAPKRAR